MKKGNSGKILAKTIKTVTWEICILLTNCLNSAILNNKISSHGTSSLTDKDLTVIIK